MPAIQYPFIDIAVQSRVREHFVNGDAMVMFSSDMQHAVWANGRGAALLGDPSVYDFLDRGPNRSDVSFRQIEASARQLSRAGDMRPVTIRVSSGFQRVPVMGSVESVRLRNGETVVLFSAPVGGKPASIAESARRIIEGFDDPDIHLAVLDGNGETIAASPGFDALGITPNTARALSALAGRDVARLVKRPIPTGKGYLPAAVGHLSDQPSLSLFFVVETVIGTMDPTHDYENDAQTAVQEPQVPPSVAPVATAQHTQITPMSGGETGDAVAAVVIPVAPTETAPQDERHSGAHTPAGAVTGNDEEARQQALRETVVATVAEPVPERPSTGVADKTVSSFVFDSSARASRFVWKIDAHGFFSEVSEEFAKAVGPKAADINGVAFSTVAARFNLDPQGKIGELLNRRDTWSGRTIWWPVEGTGLMVPIDLAALPTYTKNRDFDGFRGFGIIRILDAVEDPHAAGLTLARPVAEVPVPDVAVNAAVQTADDGQTEPEIAPAAESMPETGEPVRGDGPPLQFVSAPDRHLDKVVRFEPRRSGAIEALTPAEKAAFREIARQLVPSKSASETKPAEAHKADRVQQERNDTTTGSIPDIHPADPVIDPIAEPVENRAETIEAEAQATQEPDDRETPDIDETALAAEIVGLPTAPGSAFDATDFAIPPVTWAEGALCAEIVDQMPVALLVHSGDRLIHGNPEFLRLSGYDNLEELADVGGLDALLQRADLEDKEGAAGGMMVVRADDAIVPVTARLQSIRWEHGSALMLALMPARDPQQARTDRPAEVTHLHPDPVDNKSNDNTDGLRVEIEELRSILETATDGVVILGGDGELRSMNRAASALFNYDNDEIRGKSFAMLFAHESQRAIMDYLNGLAGHGVASVLNDGREVIGREASGGFLPLFMTIGKLSSSNGYCAVIRDITQWKRTEEELRGAKRAAETANAHKSEFLARVSHEIRTPLNAIIGFADMMATERLGQIGHPRYVEYANDIGRSGRYVLDIVNDLLDISKIEAGEMELTFASVGLNEAVSEAVSLVQPQANGQRVIIRTALSQAVPPVVADPRSIKQIVINIVSNAIRFTPSGGQIVVSTAYEANGSVSLRVRDTGIGMTRTELDQAMKPFRQVTTGTRKRGDGTGLGLPLTKAIADANRAIFSIQSAPNEGTLVEITFPSQRVLAN